MTIKDLAFTKAKMSTGVSIFRPERSKRLAKGTEHDVYLRTSPWGDKEIFLVVKKLNPNGTQSAIGSVSFFTKSGIAYVKDMAVDTKHQGKGIAAHLVKVLISKYGTVCSGSLITQEGSFLWRSLQQKAKVKVVYKLHNGKPIKIVGWEVSQDNWCYPVFATKTGGTVSLEKIVSKKLEGYQLVQRGAYFAGNV